MKITEKIEEHIRELENMSFEDVESFMLNTTFEIDHSNIGDNEQILFLAGMEQGLELALKTIECFKNEVNQ